MYFANFLPLLDRLKRIIFTLSDPLNKLVTFQARKKEGSFSDYKVSTKDSFCRDFTKIYRKIVTIDAASFRRFSSLKKTAANDKDG
jgi:hypothetical protein